MKKLFIAALAMTTAMSTAHAGTINLDMRADHQSDNYNDEATRRNTSRYYFKTIRVNYEGKVNDDLSFRLRGAYNKDGTQGSATGDNAQTALEFAYLAHKMGDFTLTVGRLGSEHGGFEAATSGADLYLTSQAYTKQAVPGALAGGWLSSSNVLYVTGAKLAYNFTPDQSLAIVGFEAPSTAAGADNANMTGLIWKGAFMDKSLKTYLTYHLGNGAGVTADRYELMSAGVAWSMDPIALSLDYVSSAFKVDATDAKDSVYSIIGKFAYIGMEQWTPRLEVISSESNLETGAGGATNGTTKFMGYGAVAEFRPFADYNNFRYHVAYHNIRQELVSGADAEVQEITVGARLYADFLK